MPSLGKIIGASIANGLGKGATAFDEERKRISTDRKEYALKKLGMQPDEKAELDWFNTLPPEEQQKAAALLFRNDDPYRAEYGADYKKPKPTEKRKVEDFFS